MRPRGRPSAVSSHVLVVLAILFWTGSAVAVGIHAFNRDRSGFLWAALVFVTGLVGLLIYVIVAGTAADEVDDDDDAEQLRRCPECERSHEGSPNYCMECGEPLDEGDDVVVARVLRSGSRGYCSNCKSRVAIDADDCPNCGAVF
jgi:hypothetical protein